MSGPTLSQPSRQYAEAGLQGRRCRRLRAVLTLAIGTSSLAACLSLLPRAVAAQQLEAAAGLPCPPAPEVVGGPVWAAYYPATMANYLPSKWILALVVGLIAGLLMCAFLVRCVCRLSVRTAEVEKLVAQRTAELQRANDALRLRDAQREETDEALRESEQRFRALVETTSDWIWAVDKDGIYTYSSPKVKDLLGYEPEDIIGTSAFDLMDPDEAETVGETFRKLLESQKPLERLENTNLHKDGHRVVLETSGVPILDAEGKLQGYRGVDRDITKPKADEIKLKQMMARLEQSNRDLEQFAYSASHDLQEPLRMMCSYLQALKQKQENLDQQARDLVDLSLDSAKRMQELIDDLLAYAHVGTRQWEFQALNFNTIVDQVVADLRATIQDQHAEVTRDVLPTVPADPVLMMQLFQNLISNAVKFHGDQPPRVHISAADQKDQCVFSVRDNGIGIDPKYGHRVFEIFERLHSSDQYPGTGIGLAICRRVVERHGGTIWHESASGQGTIFSFTVPKRKATE